MEDTLNFKGHFKIQAIDQNNTVIDEWQDDNMIMETARTTMSELFANLSASTFINKITLGTLGHVGDSILVPKGKDEGFVKERTRLFSEVLAGAITPGQTVTIIRKNDVLHIDATSNDAKGYYRFLQSDVQNYVVNDIVITDTDTWEFLGATSPYSYSVNFELSGENGAVVNLVEDEANAGSAVTVLQTGSSVTFTIDIATGAANGQNETTSVFTEAALYANSRIFAMKTFKAKVKDSTVLLRIIWTITF